MRHTTTPLLVATAVALAGAARATVIDVSEIVNGHGSTVSPPPGLLPPPVACGGACRYAVVASAGIGNGYAPAPATQVAAAWAPSWNGSVPTLSPLTQDLPIVRPLNAVLDGGSVGVGQFATVAFDWTGHSAVQRLQVQTWESGAGVATLSHAIRIATPMGGARRTYLSLALPQPAVAMQPQLDFDAASQTWIARKPVRMHARATVDVLVDGLPVWSGEVSQLLPRFPVAQPIGLSWGGALDGSRLDLYLGQLPALSTRHVAVIFRTEQRVEGVACSQQGSDPAMRRCHAQSQSLTLPATPMDPAGSFAGVRPDVQVYTR